MIIKLLLVSFFANVLTATIENSDLPPIDIVTTPGSCPPIPPETAGLCAEFCSIDEDCRAGQKCCSNGCGHACINVTTVPCNLVACKCPYGTIWSKDSNGCDICSCSNPCSTVVCQENYLCQVSSTNNSAICVPIQGQCPTLPPDTIGTCVEKCSGDESCQPGEKCCSNGCGHVCTRVIPCNIVACKCPYGTIWSKDANGCEVCSCNDPCSTVVCPNNQICQVNSTDNSPTCVCNNIMCEMYCKYGFKYDSNGCPLCKCANPCANVNCGLNKVCLPRKSSCTTYSSDCPEYTGVCINVCKMCMMYCFNGYGFIYDDTGCPTCKCLNPCKGVLCPQGSSCVVKKSDCATFSSTCQPYVGVCSSKAIETDVTDVNYLL